VFGKEDLGPDHVGLSKVVEGDKCLESGSGCVGERTVNCEQVERGDSLLGRVGQNSDPILEALSDVGSEQKNNFFSGPGESIQVSRVSFLSEPEDVNCPVKAGRKKKHSKHNRHRSKAKLQQIGVPKCLILMEAVKEGNVGARRRRVISSEVVPLEPAVTPVAPTPCATPSSGLKLITDSGPSMVLETPMPTIEADRAKLVEAAKLIEIQKLAGFTFEGKEDETTKLMIEQENCDRAKKMIWEQRNGDQ
jgi:hypothetical protein